MAKFLTRIEIQSGSWPDDYNNLHKVMTAEGFCQDIEAKEEGSNKWSAYRLPTAEYYMEINNTISYVRSLAERAANTLGKKYNIITVEFTTASWDLPIVKP